MVDSRSTSGCPPKKTHKKTPPYIYIHNISLQHVIYYSKTYLVTSIPEYTLHYQLEYLEEQNCLKIYNKNIKKKKIHLMLMFTFDRLKFWFVPK